MGHERMFSIKLHGNQGTLLGKATTKVSDMYSKCPIDGRWIEEDVDVLDDLSAVSARLRVGFRRILDFLNQFVK